MRYRNRPLILSGPAGDDLALFPGGQRRSSRSVDSVLTWLQGAATTPQHLEGICGLVGRRSGESDEELLRRFAEAICHEQIIPIEVGEARSTMRAPQVVNLSELAEPVAQLDAGAAPEQAYAFVDVEVVNEGGEPLVFGYAELTGSQQLAAEFIEQGAVRADFPEGPTKIRGTFTRLRWWGDAADVTGPSKPPSKPVEDPIIASFEDLLFNFNSPVVLPAMRADPNAPDASARIGAIEVLRTVLEVIDKSDKKVIVAGHTDTTGTRAYNKTLSQERAENVVMLLEGERDAWAAANHKKHYKVDWKLILHWVHDTFGWDCDPGPINETVSKRSQRAQVVFRARYKQQFGVHIPAGEHCREDWAGYFDLYQRELALRLSTTAEGLQQVRAKLSFMAPKALGCGESWPKQETGRDEFACEANRRVELWLFDPADVPSIEGIEPPGAPLYEQGSRYKPSYLPIGPGAQRGFEVSVVNAAGESLAGVTVPLSYNGSEFACEQTDGIGRVWVVPPGDGAVELRIADHDVYVGAGGVDEDDNVTPSVHVPDGIAGFVC